MIGNKDSMARVAIIVAHPDDETIFCGGTMLTYPEWEWQIVCVTMQTHTDRPHEFKNAMNLYKKFGVSIKRHLSLKKHDGNQDLSPKEINDWKSSIQKLNLFADIFITHNKMGEYGHNHHMELSKIVRDLFSNVWEFVYPGNVNISPQPTKSKTRKIVLAKDILREKSEIFHNCYISQVKPTWDLLPELMAYEFRTGPEIFTNGDKNEI